MATRAAEAPDRRISLLPEGLWLASWVAYWALAATHWTVASAALQAAVVFAVCVAQAVTGRPVWAVAAVVSFLPVLDLITPYGHVSPATRVGAVASLQLLAVMLLLRDPTLRAAVWGRPHRAAVAPMVRWAERILLWTGASTVGVVLAPHVHAPLTLTQNHVGPVAAMVLAIVVEEVTFRGLQFGVWSTYPAAVMLVAQFVTFGACFAADGAPFVGIVAGLLGAAAAAYRLRDARLWPVVVAHLLVIFSLSLA